MPKVEYRTKVQTPPSWAMDELDRIALIAGGGFLEEAEFSADANGKKFVPAGTLVGRTYVEKEAGTGYGVADVANDEQIYLLVHDVDDAADEAHCTLYRWGMQVKEENLPTWATMTADEKAKVRELYEVV